MCMEATIALPRPLASKRQRSRDLEMEKGRGREAKGEAGGLFQHGKKAFGGRQVARGLGGGHTAWGTTIEVLSRMPAVAPSVGSEKTGRLEVENDGCLLLDSGKLVLVRFR